MTEEANPVFAPIKSRFLPSHEPPVSFTVKLCTGTLANADLLSIFYLERTKNNDSSMNN